MRKLPTKEKWTGAAAAFTPADTYAHKLWN